MFRKSEQDENSSLSITHHVIANSGGEISVQVDIVKIIIDIWVLKITSDKKRSDKF